MDPLNYEDYLLHLGRSSVLLDPLYYGAGNSFFESMRFGKPTITFPTDYIKSRLVLGAYKQMEIKDPPIATSIQNYIDLAVRYANRDDIRSLKSTYKTAAEKKLFKIIMCLLKKLFVVGKWLHHARFSSIIIRELY